MEKIRLIIESSLGDVLQESQTFALDENWKSNEELMLEIDRMNKRSINLQNRWAAHGEDHSAKVEVDVLAHGTEGSLVFAKQVENHLQGLR